MDAVPGNAQGDGLAQTEARDTHGDRLTDRTAQLLDDPDLVPPGNALTVHPDDPITRQQAFTLGRRAGDHAHHRHPVADLAHADSEAGVVAGERDIQVRRASGVDETAVRVVELSEHPVDRHAVQLIGTDRLDVPLLDDLGDTPQLCAIERVGLLRGRRPFHQGTADAQTDQTDPDSHRGPVDPHGPTSASPAHPPAVSARSAMASAMSCSGVPAARSMAAASATSRCSSICAFSPASSSYATIASWLPSW